MNKIKVFIPHLIMLIGLAGISYGGNWVWLAFVILFLVFPILEIIFKNLKFSQTDSDSKFADLSLIMTFPLLLTILLESLFKYQELYFLSDQIGLVLSTGGLLGGFGITSAHELVHRREKFMRAVGVSNLMLVNFAHWGLEHVYGHHKYVSTPVDGASARKNEMVYVFWLRDYFGGLKSSFEIEAKKVSAYWVFTLLASLSIFYFFNLNTVIIWWAISTIAILLLLTVDYVEHYGLYRIKNAEGFYGGIKPQHSWDTSSWITNLILFNLGFHAHHHLKASIHFEELKAQPEARKLPFGYSVMVIMALFPFIYIPFMNKRLPI